MAALTIVHTEVIFAALDFFRVTLTHDCLSFTSVPLPPKFPIYADAIRKVMQTEGYELVGYLLNGLVGNFPEDSTSAVVSIFRVVAAIWTSQLLSWLPPILQQLPNATVPNEAKAQFLSEVTRYVIGPATVGHATNCKQCRKRGTI